MTANFLWNSGTSNDGLIVSAVTLMTTELNSLASAGTAVSSVGGSSGLFTNSNTGQAMIGTIMMNLGAIGSAVQLGGCVAGWFLETLDGSTFENTVSGQPQARSPDFVIPVPNTTITSGWNFKSQGPVAIPALKFKIFVQNSLGQAMAATTNTLKLGLYAAQY